VEIITGKMTGFCSGVSRAIKRAEKTLNKNQEVYCIGEIIHNPSVVKELSKKGMKVVNQISEIPDKSHLLIRSHGLQKEMIEEARRKKLFIHDFTCPRVKHIHQLVIKLIKDRYLVIVIGNPEHPEVKAIYSLTFGNARVIEKEEDLEYLSFYSPVGVVVQTTFDPEKFIYLTGKIISTSKKTLIYNTLCEETIKRQKEAKEIAENVNIVIVAGGKNSSNTKTLFEMVRKKVKTVHIENADELKKVWFQDVHKVGIVSGASTPEKEVKRVKDVLKTFSGFINKRENYKLNI